MPGDIQPLYPWTVASKSVTTGRDVHMRDVVAMRITSGGLLFDHPDLFQASSS